MKFKVAKITQHEYNRESIALEGNMRLLFSDQIIETCPDFEIYPVITVTSSEYLQAKVLDHLWLDKKHCIEIIGYRQDKNFLIGRAITPMIIKCGDTLDLIKRVIRATVILVDNEYKHLEQIEQSGNLLKNRISQYFESKHYPISVNLERVDAESKTLSHSIDTQLNSNTDIIFTVGSIGISRADIVFQIIKKAIDFEIPGVMEFIRSKYGNQNPHILLNRSISGVKDNKLIFALPHDIEAVNNYFSEIGRILIDSIYSVNNIETTHSININN